ncbi:unnamed protein product [Xylocopa violacea]|uniref:Uncharacterized protein n=1 Tax=Xylocopa violacea TaxID=135666 RepID=A0ABP1MZT7_XYLVO
MGEVHSIVETVDGWIRRLRRSDRAASRDQVPETKVTIETNDTIFDHEMWRQAFLVDAPVLRGLLFGVSIESNLYEVVCTINRLIFFYVIIKWINFEVWSAAGAEPFVLNR